MDDAKDHSDWQPLLPADRLTEGSLQRCLLPTDATGVADGGQAGHKQTGLPESLPAAVLLCRVDGDIHVLDDTCPHEAISLSLGSLQGHRLRCPLHGSEFDVRDGSVLSEPCETALRRFDSTVRDGWICLRRQRPDQGKY